MAMEVGFLGLGIMGKAMATNLLRKGFKVTVWNKTLSKALYEEAIPFFDVLGKKSFFLGQVGNGAKMELVVNMIMGR
ncbi:glyoxylate/succinic semialdehyde reductase 1-like [Castanea sativa]|uniref:glyoxylate/succinic semialdehyde reductase 1-like n=1 Tax=Castanea sativa TaxID=21020 RepID=UPI003F64CA67